MYRETKRERERVSGQKLSDQTEKGEEQRKEESERGSRTSVQTRESQLVSFRERERVERVLDRQSIGFNCVYGADLSKA